MCLICHTQHLSAIFLTNILVLRPCCPYITRGFIKEKLIAIEFFNYDPCYWLCFVWLRIPMTVLYFQSQIHFSVFASLGFICISKGEHFAVNINSHFNISILTIQQIINFLFRIKNCLLILYATIEENGALPNTTTTKTAFIKDILIPAIKNLKIPMLMLKMKCCVKTVLMLCYKWLSPWPSILMSVPRFDSVRNYSLMFNNSCLLLP